MSSLAEFFISLMFTDTMPSSSFVIVAPVELPKKLKQNPLQGVIKIEERFDNNFSIEEYHLSNDVQCI